jgi:thiol-disulfide isomerase/thioredoxin
MKKFLLLLVASSALAAEKPVFLEDLFTERLVPVDLKTNPTLVSFIQPSCIPCKMQLEALECIRKKYGKGVTVLAVQSVGDPASLKRGLKPMHLSFPVLRGTPKFLATYEADQMPTPMTVVFQKGKPTERILGAQPCAFWMERVK